MTDLPNVGDQLARKLSGSYDLEAILLTAVNGYTTDTDDEIDEPIVREIAVDPQQGTGNIVGHRAGLSDDLEYQLRRAVGL